MKRTSSFSSPVAISLAALTLLLSLSLPLRAVAAPAWWPFGGNAKEVNTAAPASSSAPSPAVQVDQAPVDRGLQVTTSFSPIVKKVAPSVVTVFTAKKVSEQAGGGNPLLNDPFFQRFFGQQGGGQGGDQENGNPGLGGNPQLQPQPQRPRTQEQNGLGSGVIISADGYIVTNVHVVDMVDEIKVEVTAADGTKKKYDAKVIGKDALSDIALLKIDAKDLPAMILADSSKIEVGDVVLAIGNPFALGQTVTMGIISGLGRDLTDSGSEIQDFIQTDAAINPGNSGGPLVDTNGRMVGVNSAIFTRSGGYMGIGFAIPSNTVRYVIDSLLKKGRVIRGYLGVKLSIVTPDLAEKFNLPDESGVVVDEVEPDSAAAAAGVQAGDVIVEFNSQKVEDYHTLRLAVTAIAPGQKVSMTVIRDGKPKSLDVTLKELPDTAEASPSQDESEGDNGAAAPATQELLPGVQIATLDAAVRRQLSNPPYPADLKGVVVLSVDPDSAAAANTSGSQGLQPGDVILEVEHKEVATAKEAIAAARNAKGGILLRVWTRGNPRYIVIKPN